MTQQEPLTPAETARLLRISEDKLYKLRASGKGPAYTRLGHRTIRYERTAVIAWLQASSVLPEGASL